MSDNEDDRATAQEDLHRKVFGGDSDSDFSSDDEDGNRRKASRSADCSSKSPSFSRARGSASPVRSAYSSPARSPVSARSVSRSVSPSEGRDGRDGEDDGDYEREESAKKMSFKRKSSRGDKESADGAVEGGKKKKRRKDSGRDRSAEPDLDQLEPEMDAGTLRRLELNRKIDAIVKAPRKASRKKNGDDDLDMMADDMIQNIKEKMFNAADQDELAVVEKRPAIAKLAMLKEVVAILQRTTLTQSIIDNDLLSAVKKWLEPLPDKSLPALDIQTAFFDILVKMDIERDTLKSSGLGQPVLFYTKSRRVTTYIKRQAEKLLAAWSRPLVNRSASWKSKPVPTLDDLRMPGSSAPGGGGGGAGGGERRGGALKAVLGSQKADNEVEREKGKRRGVRIPQSTRVTFTHAPRYEGPSQNNSSQSAELSQEQLKRQRDMERMKKIKNKLNAARNAERL
ncbi:Uncharacterized conserved protein [Phaffia rhodozyma]|uniref:Uncharacterized conserved protein n=1 Tax=Phaffia rhodozyma TaxID=264483 RepID=A0A0F7SJP6_PHARH|nr:Uncharacterized conserved protein [Phaffia rhodozyma]